MVAPKSDTNNSKIILKRLLVSLLSCPYVQRKTGKHEELEKQEKLEEE